MRAASPRGDAGETLVEVLLSITIMGIALVALLAGMGTAATTAGLNERQTGQVQGLQSAVQAILGAPYLACGTGAPVSYPPASYSDPLGYVVTVTNIRYQQDGGYVASGGEAFGAVCPINASGTATDLGAQQMRVNIHQNDGRVRDEAVVIVKRKPCSTTDPSC